MFCTQCGAKNNNDARFCTSCGATLNQSDAAPQTPAAVPAPAMAPAPSPSTISAMNAPVSTAPAAKAPRSGQQPLWAIIVAVVCAIETILLVWILIAKPAQTGNKKNLEGVVNLFSLAAEGISAANDYSFRASAKAEGNTVVITVKFPSVVFDRSNSSSNEWTLCQAADSSDCYTYTEKDMDDYNNMIAKEYIGKIQNDFRQMTGISNLGFTVKLTDKDGTLIASIPIDKYLESGVMQ